MKKLFCLLSILFCCFNQYAMQQNLNFALHDLAQSLRGLESKLKPDKYLTDFVKRNALEQVKQALVKGVSPDEQDERGHIPLSQSIAFSFHDISKLLLAKGADINREDGEGSTPLRYAISFHNVEIFKELMNRGANWLGKDYAGFTPLEYAKFRLDFASKEQRTQKVADEIVNLNAIITFLEEKARGQMPLVQIQQLEKIILDLSSHESAVQKFKLSASVNTKNIDPVSRRKLIWKLQTKDPSKDYQKIAQDLGFENPQRIAKEMKMLDDSLFSNISSKRWGAVEGALNNGANPNAQNAFGYPVFNQAVSTGFLEIVQTFLDADVDINIQSITGVTPLYEAIIDVFPEIVILLAKKGAKQVVEIQKNKKIYLQDIAKQQLYEVENRIIELQKRKQDQAIINLLKEARFKKTKLEQINNFLNPPDIV